MSRTVSRRLSSRDQKRSFLSGLRPQKSSAARKLCFEPLEDRRLLAVLLSENFDGVTAPALPVGWSTSNTGTAGANWVTSTTTPNSAPNSAFVPDNPNVGNNLLDTPSIAISGSTPQLTFQNNFNLESSFDGGVLEISINGGAYSDIITAGGSFVSGGYNGVMEAVSRGAKEAIMKIAGTQPGTPVARGPCCKRPFRVTTRRDTASEGLDTAFHDSIRDAPGESQELQPGSGP